MKKKNLNFLLALLAALALVFAGACSDGSDDTSADGSGGGTGSTETEGNNGGGNTGNETPEVTDYAASYYGTEWSVSATITAGTTQKLGLEAASLKFGSSTSSAELGLTIHENSTDAEKYKTWTGSVSIASWSVASDGTTVTVTLPAVSEVTDACVLTLVKEQGESEDDTVLRLSATDPATGAYTVSISSGFTAVEEGAGGSYGSGTTLDLFATASVSGALQLVAGADNAGTEFVLQQEAQQ